MHRVCAATAGGRAGPGGRPPAADTLMIPSSRLPARAAACISARARASARDLGPPRRMAWARLGTRWASGAGRGQEGRDVSA